MHHILDEWNGPAPDLETFQIKGHSEQNVAHNINNMTGRNIPGIAPSLDDELALPRFS